MRTESTDQFTKSRILDFVRGRVNAFKDSEQIQMARNWLSANQQSIETLFNHQVLSDFVFEPFKHVFEVPGEGEARKARQVITRVALANAVIAGLPGSLGVGVFVSLGLELWMAYALSRVVGLNLTKDEAIDTLIAWAIGAGSVLVLFKLVLNLVFPIITAMMPVAGLGTALTQLVVTNFFGVLFWILFEELKTNRRFTFPMTSLVRLGTETAGLLKHQFSAGRNAFSPSKWKLMGGRFWTWLKGDIPTDMPALRGELVSTVAMAWLIAGDNEKLSGPLGQEFIGAIRDRFPDLVDAPIDGISERMAQFDDPEEMLGVISLIKGKLFERLVERYENSDSDVWTAVLHEDESYPGSDVVFSNMETGERIEISLKATDSAAYLEDALLKYPEVPIIATDEVVGSMADNHLIGASGISNQDLSNVTEENFEELLQRLEPVAMEVAAGGVAAKALVMLWPFVVAHLRGRISRDQLHEACTRLLPKTGSALASRLAYAAALGPVFAWWVLARGVWLLTPEKRSESKHATRRLILQVDSTLGA